MHNEEAAKKIYRYFFREEKGRQRGQHGRHNEESLIGQKLFWYLQDHASDLGQYVEDNIPQMIRNRSSESDCVRIILEYLNTQNIDLSNALIDGGLSAGSNLAIYQKLFSPKAKAIPEFLVINPPYITYSNTNVTIDFNFDARTIAVGQLKGAGLANQMHNRYPNLVKKEHCESSNDFKIPFNTNNLSRLMSIFSGKLIHQDHAKALASGLNKGLQNGLDPDGPSKRR